MTDAAGYNEKVDTEKLLPSLENIKKGIDNYSLFQRFPLFKWPAWIDSEDVNSNNIVPVYPPLLLNNHLHQWVAFSNLISREELQIDPSGMICTSDSSCSIEIWMVIGGDIYRAQDRHQSVTIERETETGVGKIAWKDRLFTVTTTMIGARSTIDESVIDVQCRLKEKTKNASIMIVVRPYNILNLGTAESVSYDSASRVVTINGRSTIALQTSPDFVLSGSGAKGDVDVALREDSTSTQCENGLATLGLGFKLSKNEKGIVFRIGLSGKDGISPGPCDPAVLKNEFSSFIKMRMKEGAVLQFPDRNIQDWFNTLKINMLGVIERDIYPDGDTQNAMNCRSLYYISRGLNRMAYYRESLKIMEEIKERFSFNKKSPQFNGAIDCCYLLGIFADYFMHTRDLDYIQKNYQYVKDLAGHVFRFFGPIKNIRDLSENSLKTYLVKSPQYHDLVLAASSLYYFSYISRCMGIFGDENRFLQESKRLQGLFVEHVRAKYVEGSSISNDFFYTDIYAAYPFLTESLSRNELEKLINTIFGYYKSIPIHVKSLGIDIFSSILIAHNILRMNDKRIYDILKKIFKVGGKTFCLPEFVSPGSMNGVWGDGCSKIISAELFSLLRDIIFIDLPERLEIFPVPLEEWFIPGKDIIIEDAPSRFGGISFRVATTQNEVQFHFDKLPKYVPPEILITLPFKTKIVEGDDFILKKFYDNSFLINGWPSIIRFIK
ncbi:MAG: hypothetical protein CVV44_14905 [Spirochaetae bacterium HGW-Spirochaetae-1]|jgi:hypothetical protein|nr:MAG: hypothetical protein CVV44_14905 [Spirochaetae bacterium HGW-Spirochaetae-1]